MHIRCPEHLIQSVRDGFPDQIFFPVLRKFFIPPLIKSAHNLAAGALSELHASHAVCDDKEAVESFPERPASDKEAVLVDSPHIADVGRPANIITVFCHIKKLPDVEDGINVSKADGVSICKRFRLIGCNHRSVHIGVVGGLQVSNAECTVGKGDLAVLV